MMEWLKYIFTTPLLEAGEFDLTVLKILLLLAVIFVTQKAIQFYRKFITKLFERNEWLDDERTSFMRKYGTYFILFIAFMVSFAGLGFWSLVEAFMGFTFFESRETKFKFSVGNIFVIVAIFFIAGFIARLVRMALKKHLSKREWIERGKEFTLLKLITYFIYVVAFIVAVESIGADLSSLLLASAALLVGVGLGLQFIFADIVSGFILLFEGTFKVGDVIELNSSGPNSSGASLVARVDRIDVRTSKVVTRDGNYIIIPNSTLTRDNIVNWSHSHEVTRFRIGVGVAYGSDTKKVRQILKDCASSHPEVDHNRPIIVRFSDFGDSSLDFELFFWAAQTWTIETVKSDIRFKIDQRFRDEGVQIPFPQRDLHIRSDATKAFVSPKE